MRPPACLPAWLPPAWVGFQSGLPSTLLTADVYCKIYVRDKRKLTTQIRTNTTKPKWGE